MGGGGVREQLYQGPSVALAAMEIGIQLCFDTNVLKW